MSLGDRESSRISPSLKAILPFSLCHVPSPMAGILAPVFKVKEGVDILWDGKVWEEGEKSRKLLPFLRPAFSV